MITNLSNDKNQLHNNKQSRDPSDPGFAVILSYPCNNTSAKTLKNSAKHKSFISIKGFLTVKVTAASHNMVLTIAVYTAFLSILKNIEVIIKKTKKGLSMQGKAVSSARIVCRIAQLTADLDILFLKL